MIIGIASTFNTEETDKIVNWLMSEGRAQAWWTSYGGLRALVATMGLDVSKTHLFDGPIYIGSTLDELVDYISAGEDGDIE